jgi:uncharacterized iron-regulated membrane protein
MIDSSAHSHAALTPTLSSGRERGSSVYFWIHLTSGVLASLFITSASVTGITLAFEKDILAATDPTPTSKTVPPVDTWLTGAASVTLFRDNFRMPVVMHGREHRFVVDEHGALIPAEGAFHNLHALEELHRQLLLHGDAKQVGNFFTGANALLFMTLGLTGLIIWWPKKLKAAQFKAKMLFTRGLKGWRRDFNWHHVIGIWLLPVLLGISFSGVVIAYDWAKDAVTKVAGGAAKTPTPTVEPGGEQLPYSALLERAFALVPEWESATLQLEQRGAPLPEGQRNAVSIIIIERARNLPFSRHTIALHPVTGEVLQHLDFESSSPAQKARGVLRFLHTGEVFGTPGQIIVVVACLGILVLVWTGLALSWRRFFRPPLRAAAGDR